MKLSIIIPVFNEKDTIQEIIKKVKGVNLEKEIIVVDDYSTDGTREILKNYEKEMKILYQKENLGKGSAIRKALKEITGDWVIIQDADLEYDPQDYHLLIKSIVEGKTKVVYGSRYLNRRNILPLNRFKIGVITLNWLIRILYGKKITDEATCYKMFKTDFLKTIPLGCKRFEFCPEVTAKILKRGYDILEVPISCHRRTAKQGKKIGWRDGLEAAWTLIKYRFTR